MRQAASIITTVASVAALLGSLTLLPTGSAVAEASSAVAEGKKIAFNRKKGNCIACHMMDNGALPGNIGPPLVAMSTVVAPSGRHSESFSTSACIGSLVRAPDCLDNAPNWA